METRGYVVAIEKPVVAVGHHTAFVAEQELSGCEACTESASIPFEAVVLELTGYNPSEATCILPQPSECPRCSASIVENTRVYRGRAKQRHVGYVDLWQARH
jgi:hypothetical protein